MVAYTIKWHNYKNPYEFYLDERPSITIYYCDVDNCYFTALYESDLITHQKRHQDIIFYRCFLHQCRKQFAQKENFDKHIASHHTRRRSSIHALLNERNPIDIDKKPYTCLIPNCRFRTSYKSNLRRHIKLKHHCL